MRSVWLSLVLACSSSPGPTDPAPALDDDPTVTGEVRGEVSIACPAGAPSAAGCTQITVLCPRLSELIATVAVTDPGNAKGTVLLHSRFGGTAWLDDGFVDAYRAAGFRVVQVEWESDWQQSEVGIKHAACRVATLIQWVFAHAHGSDRSSGFCAQAYGGGSGGLGFTLAHYSMGDTLDAVSLTAGPPFSRIDVGCDPASMPRAACDEIPSVPTVYTDGVHDLVSTWEVAPTCGSSSATATEKARWAADSILSPDAVTAYPRTSVAAWYCTTAPDATVGQGSMFMDAVTTDKAVHCFTGACSGEAPWPAALPDMVADMVARCVPRH